MPEHDHTKNLLEMLREQRDRFDRIETLVRLVLYEQQLELAVWRATIDGEDAACHYPTGGN